MPIFSSLDFKGDVLLFLGQIESKKETLDVIYTTCGRNLMELKA